MSHNRVLFWIVFLVWSAVAVALEQQVTIDGKIPVRINGAASAEVLKVPVYVAALYVETPSSDPERLLDPTQARRMVFRFQARFSKTQWSRYLREQIAINAPKSEIQATLPALGRFLDLFQGALKDGDELLIDAVPGQGLKVVLDGRELGRIEDESLFNVLLRLWIGPRPPSEDFKAAILANNVSEAAARAYDAIAYSKQRTGEIARWALRARLAEAADTPVDASAGKASVEKTQKDTSQDKKMKPAESSKGSQGGKTSGDQQGKRPSITKKKVGSKPASKASRNVVRKGPQDTAPKVDGNKEQKSSPSDVNVAQPVSKPVAKKKQTTVPVATASLTDDEIKALEEGYQEMVIDQILENKTYPYQAMKRSYNKRSALANPNVVVTLSITLDRQGKVKDRKLVASSGERILDREALKLVERSQPFPAFPRLYPHETMTFDVKVPYHIR